MSASNEYLGIELRAQNQIRLPVYLINCQWYLDFLQLASGNLQEPFIILDLLDQGILIFQNAPKIHREKNSVGYHEKRCQGTKAGLQVAQSATFFCNYVGVIALCTRPL